MHSQPLFALKRAGLPEVLVSGVCVFAADGVKAAEGAETRIFSRSLLKPWQFLALGLDFDDTDHWSICVSSHNGEETHLQTLSAIATKYNLDASLLQCPVLPGKTRLQHPCSGKHLSYLLAAKENGFSSKYLDPHHPLQKNLERLLKNRLPNENIQWAEDSCGLPNASMSIASLMKLWQHLGTADDAPCQKLRALVAANPYLLGGKDRLDSRIITLGKGQLLAKEGADGLLVVQSLGDSPQTCFVKIASGYEPKYLEWALLGILEKYADHLNTPLQDLWKTLKNRLPETVPRTQTLSNLIL